MPGKAPPLRWRPWSGSKRTARSPAWDAATQAAVGRRGARHGRIPQRVDRRATRDPFLNGVALFHPASLSRRQRQRGHRRAADRRHGVLLLRRGPAADRGGRRASVSRWECGVQHDPVIAVLDLAFTSSFFEFGIGTGFSVLAQAGMENYETGAQATSAGTQIDPLIAGGGASHRTARTVSTSRGITGRGLDQRRLSVPGRRPFPSSTCPSPPGSPSSWMAVAEAATPSAISASVPTSAVSAAPGSTIVSLGLGGAGILDGDKQIPDRRCCWGRSSGCRPQCEP